MIVDKLPLSLGERRSHKCGVFFSSSGQLWRADRWTSPLRDGSLASCAPSLCSSWSFSSSASFRGTKEGNTPVSTDAVLNTPEPPLRWFQPSLTALWNKAGGQISAAACACCSANLLFPFCQAHSHLKVCHNVAIMLKFICKSCTPSTFKSLFDCSGSSGIICSEASRTMSYGQMKLKWSCCVLMFNTMSGVPIPNSAFQQKHHTCRWARRWRGDDLGSHSHRTWASSSQPCIPDYSWDKCCHLKPGHAGGM